MVEPVTQWFGSGFGQKGSTSNIGACAACAATVSDDPIGARVTENAARRRNHEQPDIACGFHRSLREKWLWASVGGL